MGFANPVGESVRYSGRNYNVIGVIDDMIKETPFKPVPPSFFILNYKNVNAINIRLVDKVSTSEALDKVAMVFKKYDPGSPFEYKFMDDEYGQKFYFEERIGKIAGFFAILAIFISCLGLFGLASFVAEQRTREIGVRKVLGASVFNVWKLLSNEFIVLVIISLFISMPVTWYYMHSWLQNYEYRTDLSWWIFLIAGIGAVTITILTVSFQAIKAALMNPAKTLRTE
jgi:ABC-type antimicrobial peptide transport system permease subunit